MRPALWFVFALVVDVFALDLWIFHGDVFALYSLFPVVMMSFTMALVKADNPNLFGGK
jgi:hypothetical protein